jgi:putative membrane protein
METVDSKYIQQHLANERTYLAWIRTAIAIAGVGFLVTNLHFNPGSEVSDWADKIVQAIGYLSVVLGILTLVFSTISYLRKRKQINEQTFESSHAMVLFLTACLVLVFLIFFVYLLVR